MDALLLSKASCTEPVCHQAAYVSSRIYQDLIVIRRVWDSSATNHACYTVNMGVERLKLGRLRRQRVEQLIMEANQRKAQGL